MDVGSPLFLALESSPKRQEEKQQTYVPLFNSLDGGDSDFLPTPPATVSTASSSGMQWMVGENPTLCNRGLFDFDAPLPGSSDFGQVGDAAQTVTGLEVIDNSFEEIDHNPYLLLDWKALGAEFLLQQSPVTSDSGYGSQGPPTRDPGTKSSTSTSWQTPSSGDYAYVSLPSSQRASAKSGSSMHHSVVSDISTSPPGRVRKSYFTTRYKCVLCSKELASRSGCKRHLEDQHIGRKLHRCEGCEQTFESVLTANARCSRKCPSPGCGRWNTITAERGF